MIIKQIKLINFRQFKHACIDFAIKPGPNVTLIHGDQGHGKTAILNAFRWVLHGPSGVAKTLSDPEIIVHRDVAKYGDNLVPANPEAEAKVILIFTRKVEDEGDMHITIERSIYAKNQKELQHAGLLKVKVQNLSNPASLVENLTQIIAQDYINAIIPEGILDILFFDGEGIDKLTSGQNPNLSEAVRTILGFRVLESAIVDLRSTKKYFESKRKDAAGDDLRKKYEEEDSIESDKIRTNLNLKEIDQYITKLKSDKDGLNKILSDNEQVRGLTEQRSNLERELAVFQNIHEKIVNDLRTFLRENSVALLSRRLSTHGEKLEKEFRDKGDFPAPISRKYISELINKEICICGRTLCANSIERLTVESYLKLARDNNFHESASSVATVLKDISAKHKSNLEKLRELRSSYLRSLGDIGEKERELLDINSQISTFSNVNIIELQQKYEVVCTEIGRQKQIRSDVIGRLPDLDSRLEKVQREIKDLEVRKRDTQIAGRRVDLITQAISKITEIIHSASEQVGNSLNSSLNEAFQSFNNVTGRARVERSSRGDGMADSFTPVALIFNGEKWDKETGINKGRQQCLSLAFIKSLVAIASDSKKFNIGIQGVFPSYDYPIVMDAPFGVLTEGPSVKVAIAMPQLASQVVCLVNHKSYAGLKQQLDDSNIIGKKYYLYRNYNPDDTESQIQIVEIGNNKVQISGPSSDQDLTVYSEVRILN